MNSNVNLGEQEYQKLTHILNQETINIGEFIQASSPIQTREINPENDQSTNSNLKSLAINLNNNFDQKDFNNIQTTKDLPTKSTDNLQLDLPPTQSQPTSNERRNREKEKSNGRNKSLKRVSSAERTTKSALQTPKKPSTSIAKSNKKSNKNEKSSTNSKTNTIDKSSLNPFEDSLSILKSDYSSQSSTKKNKILQIISSERLLSPSKISAIQKIAETRSPGSKETSCRNSSIKKYNGKPVKETLNESISNKKGRNSNYNSPKNNQQNRTTLSTANSATKIIPSKTTLKIKVFEPVLKKSTRSSAYNQPRSATDNIESSQSDNHHNPKNEIRSSDFVKENTVPDKIKEEEEIEYKKVDKEEKNNDQEIIQEEHAKQTNINQNQDQIDIISQAKNDKVDQNDKVYQQNNIIERHDNKIHNDDSDIDIDRRTKEILKAQFSSNRVKTDDTKENKNLEKVSTSDPNEIVDSVISSKQPNSEVTSENKTSQELNSKPQKNIEIFDIEEEPRQLLPGKCDPIPNPNQDIPQEDTNLISKTQSKPINQDINDISLSKEEKLINNLSSVKSKIITSVLNSQKSPKAQMKVYKTLKQSTKASEISPKKSVKTKETNERQSRSKNKYTN